MIEETWGTPGKLTARQIELLDLFETSTLSGQQQILAFAQIVQQENPEVHTAKIITFPVRAG